MSETVTSTDANLTHQSCPTGEHPDWWIASESTHPCPGCRIAELKAELDDLPDEATIRIQIAEEARAAAAEFQQEMRSDAATLRWFAERITAGVR